MPLVAETGRAGNWASPALIDGAPQRPSHRGALAGSQREEGGAAFLRAELAGRAEWPVGPPAPGRARSLSLVCLPAGGAVARLWGGGGGPRCYGDGGAPAAPGPAGPTPKGSRGRRDGAAAGAALPMRSGRAGGRAPALPGPRSTLRSCAWLAPADELPLSPSRRRGAAEPLGARSAFEFPEGRGCRSEPPFPQKEEGLGPVGSSAAPGPGRAGGSPGVPAAASSPPGGQRRPVERAGLF